MEKFLLICPIGLENCVLKELELKDLMDEIKLIETIKGGVIIETSLSSGLALNYSLKTVSRILLRLKEQKCRDFPKLFQIISKLPLHGFIVQEEVDFRISTQKSRIINTKKAQETCENALKKYLIGQKIKSTLLEAHRSQDKQRIYIRIEEDLMTISIDTTGVMSHIRGNKERQGHAPLRETYASCLLLYNYKNEYQDYSLVDPMCGSATFLTEARDFYKSNTREYIFERWPISKKLQIKKVDQDKKLFKQLLGFDRDESLIKAMTDIKLEKKNFFEEDFNLPSNCFIINNPPYGKRIKIAQDRKDYFENYISRLQRINPQGTSLFICPSEIPLRQKKIHQFNNNGIKVNLYLVN